MWSFMAEIYKHKNYTAMSVTFIGFVTTLLLVHSCKQKVY